MNYVILNGNKSTAVQGLLIQELPPVSKPQMRSSIETIDGRDGDLITRLGYAAYDKILTIGLKKGADINDVISYFVNNNEGAVTFSNEPDFYYRYSILEAIDFERLIRFRQAKVTMHIQPFKFSLNEGNTEFLLPADKNLLVINSGNIYSKPIISIKGFGDVNVSLNGTQIFTIQFSTTAAETITIDTEAMEAYDDRKLRNRDVTGDYNKFHLQIGRNAIKFGGTGVVSEVLIEKYSRWI